MQNHPPDNAPSLNETITCRPLSDYSLAPGCTQHSTKHSRVRSMHFPLANPSSRNCVTPGKIKAIASAPLDSRSHYHASPKVGEIEDDSARSKPSRASPHATNAAATLHVVQASVDESTETKTHKTESKLPLVWRANSPGNLMHHPCRSYIRALSYALINWLPWKVTKSGDHCILLAKKYWLHDPIQSKQFVQQFSSHVLLTYRHSFDPPVGDVSRDNSLDSESKSSRLINFLLGGSDVRSNAWNRLTSDSGWGCVVRVFQMSIVQALKSLVLGEDWMRPATITDTYPAKLISILQTCLDTPSSRFSIHRVVGVGKSKLGIQPGQWFGPTSCAKAFHLLINGFALPEEPYVDGKVHGGIKQTPFPFPLTITHRNKTYSIGAYHSDNGEIDCHLLYRMMLGSTQMSRQLSSSSIDEDRHCIPRAASWSHPLAQRFDAVIILLSLRLGLEIFNLAYKPFILGCFALPHFQGLVGGGPLTSAYWFIAASNEFLYFLDPHTRVQKAVKELEMGSDGVVVENGICNSITSFEANFFPDSPKRLNWRGLNPSMTLVFVCKSYSDFSILKDRLEEINTEGVVNFNGPLHHHHGTLGVNDKHKPNATQADDGFLLL